MGALRFIRQLCCFRQQQYDDEEGPSRLVPLTTTATSQPSFHSGTRRLREAEVVFRRRLADLASVTRLNPTEGSETLARHYASQFNKPSGSGRRSWWAEYQESALDPHCRWS
ncbi:hypothetical protein VTL71DRAFT_10049 [Oculimacula yallundae]|uniref:Uncharacterized protein n=1 Tax=Oculimacula yallundae TaxID=86028 RepID=A0ABR4BQ72_9HELO